jgi:hypothetical protein
VTTLNAILGDLPFFPVQLGESFGYLRMNPDSNALTPKDIPVFTELPLELSVVAGYVAGCAPRVEDVIVQQ